MADDGEAWEVWKVWCNVPVTQSAVSLGAAQLMAAVHARQVLGVAGRLEWRHVVPLSGNERWEATLPDEGGAERVMMIRRGR